MTDPTERPLLRIVRGTPDDEELAAVTALVAALAAGGPAAQAHAPRSRWADRTSIVRRPLPTGPGAWRASGFPG